MKYSIVFLSLCLPVLLHAQGWIGVNANQLYPISSSLNLSQVKVGIGTNNPTHVFHTVGDIKFEDLQQGNQSYDRQIVINSNGLVGWKTLLPSAGQNSWLLGGNNNVGPSNNIFGTLSNEDLRIVTNGLGNERVRITKNGIVGVGETNPMSLLHLKGNQQVDNIFRVDDNNGDNVFRVTEGKYVEVTGGTSGVQLDPSLGTRARFSVYTGGDGFWCNKNYWTFGGLSPSNRPHATFISHTQHMFLRSSWDSSLKNNFYIGNKKDQYMLAIHANGKIGIGIHPSNSIQPAYTLDVDRDIRARGIVYCNTNNICSDGRFKDDISQIENSSDLLMKVNGYRFTYKKESYPERNFSEKPAIGVIAQEVKDILPEIVSVDNEGFYSVNYDGLIPLIIETIKEQQDAIKKLEKEILELKKMNIKLASNTNNKVIE